MYNRKPRKTTAYNYRVRIRRKRIVFTIAVLIVLGVIIALVRPASIKPGAGTGIQRREILRLWEEASYLEVYEQCKNALETRPTDYFLLRMCGFSAFQLGDSRINNLDAAFYFDECIWSLRRAMLNKTADNDGGLFYVLGKAYWYKGESYADLSVKYLEKALELSYNASDIPEFLGMAYALIGDYRNSVAAFSMALNTAEDSTELLLHIARSYIALDEHETARAYLIRCIDVSTDSNAVFQAKLLLSEILVNSGDISGAVRLLAGVLEESGTNAEVHFRLGELYSRQGDTARARAEWRLALRADPAHAGVRQRLSL